MTDILRKIGCFFGYHDGGVVALGSAIGRFGPRYLYQCKRCKRHFSEPWGR